MNKLKIFKNIGLVALSNITTVISGILVGFLIPKIMSVDSYGYYKTFTLYATYTGFFSLGMVDGIVLKYGGYNYDELNKRSFRSIFRVYILLHVFFFIVLCFISFFLNDSKYTFIIINLALFMVAGNITGFFQQISQITQRFKEYSARRIIQSLLNIVLVMMLFIFFKVGYEIDYKIYTGIWVMINIVLMFWYIITYKDLVFGEGIRLKTIRSDVKSLIIIGFPLLFANLCSTLILNLDRQFVNILFDNSTYAVYAFAYNMLALVTVATSAVSTVLYPTLKRVSKEAMMGNYSKLIGTMLALVFGANILYFPLCIFIRWFLPKYSESLVIFRIIFPGLAITSAITVVMHNYYKALEENFKYFKKSIIILVLSAVANYLAYSCFKTTISISIASIVVMIFWYLFIEQFLINKTKSNRFKNLGYLLIMMMVFYGTTVIDNVYISMLLYLSVYVVVTYFFIGKERLKKK